MVRTRRQGQLQPRQKPEETELEPPVKGVKGRGKVVKTTPRDVLLFYPNIVGYLRVLFSLASFFFAQTNWKLSVVAYLLSFSGDLLDGKLARHFDQCSKLGGVLDMVTDRCTTAGLLAVLGILYPRNGIWFILLMIIDLSSHWVHVVSTASEGHHKDSEVLEDRNFLLQLYYGVYPFFGYLCVGTEIFYVLLYTSYFLDTGSPIFFYIIWVVCFPACLMKQMVNLAQLSSACYALAQVDATERNRKGK